MDSHLCLGVNGTAIFDQTFCDIDTIFLGSQVERGQSILGISNMRHINDFHFSVCQGQPSKYFRNQSEREIKIYSSTLLNYVLTIRLRLSKFALPWRMNLRSSLPEPWHWHWPCVQGEETPCQCVLPGRQGVMEWSHSAKQNKTLQCNTVQVLIKHTEKGILLYSLFNTFIWLLAFKLYKNIPQMRQRPGLNRPVSSSIEYLKDVHVCHHYWELHLKDRGHTFDSASGSAPYSSNVVAMSISFFLAAMCNGV